MIVESREKNPRHVTRYTHHHYYLQVAAIVREVLEAAKCNDDLEENKKQCLVVYNGIYGKEYVTILVPYDTFLEAEVKRRRVLLTRLISCYAVMLSSFSERTNQ